MNHKKNLLIVIGTCLILAFSILLISPGAEAAIYKYIDKNGGVHFTDRIESIPKEYRNQIQTLPMETPPQPAIAPAAIENKKEADLDKALDEEKKKDAALKSALEKAVCEEKKLKGREEKVNRISELQKEIENRRQEMQNLRTTWMVYDRSTIFRLNNEIDEIQQQIQGIQQEMAAENQPCP
jgi:hypothetical protein